MSWSGDRTLCLWDAASGRQVGPATLSFAGVIQADRSPIDGTERSNLRNSKEDLDVVSSKPFDFGSAQPPQTPSVMEYDDHERRGLALQTFILKVTVADPTQRPPFRGLASELAASVAKLHDGVAEIFRAEA